MTRTALCLLLLPLSAGLAPAQGLSLVGVTYNKKLNTTCEKKINNGW